MVKPFLLFLMKRREEATPCIVMQHGSRGLLQEESHASQSRSKYQRAREPQKYARTSKPWIHRGVARTKAATVQTTSNRERTSASKSRAADLIAYARIWFGGAKDPTRPSEHERYGWGEGTPNSTQKPKTWSKVTHALCGGSEPSARQAVAARSTRAARAPHDPCTHTNPYFKEEGRCGVVPQDLFI